MNNLDVMFTSTTDEWQTPIDFFNKCNEEFKFTLDGAANESNHLLPNWYGPGSQIAEDALNADWEGRIWCNPPYSMCKEFVSKAWEAMHYGVFTAMLIPARTDTKYWHSYIWNESKNNWRWGVQARFIKGRLKFINPGQQKQNSAPFPSVLILFGNPDVL